jgi:hypothetical protein
MSVEQNLQHLRRADIIEARALYRTAIGEFLGAIEYDSDGIETLGIHPSGQFQGIGSHPARLISLINCHRDDRNHAAIACYSVTASD